MNRKGKITLGVVGTLAALGIIGAINGDEVQPAPAAPVVVVTTEAPEPVETTTKASEFPEGFSPAVQARIDTAAKAQDCVTLQSEFDAADANQQASRDRGADPAALMDYIDKRMAAAGCYSG